MICIALREQHIFGLTKNTFEPLRIKSFPDFLAVVFREPASDPANLE
jgi:hypothetical protein